MSTFVFLGVSNIHPQSAFFNDGFHRYVFWGNFFPGPEVGEATRMGCVTAEVVLSFRYGTTVVPLRHPERYIT